MIYAVSLAETRLGQKSNDGDKNGLFTEVMLKVYNNGRFKGNYAGLLATMLKQMPADQTPNYCLSGRRNFEFESSVPFKK